MAQLWHQHHWMNRIPGNSAAQTFDIPAGINIIKASYKVANCKTIFRITTC